MEPLVFLIALSILFGVPAITVITVARLRAARAAAPSPDATSRFEALESDVQRLQQDLAETQERLDFTERLLTKAREERRLAP
jgi:predicted  nucleic acid-binding Zn-ribbon protein